MLVVVDSRSNNQASTVHAQDPELATDDDEHEEEYALLGSEENLRDGGDAIKDLLTRPSRVVSFVLVLMVVKRIDAAAMSLELDGNNPIGP